MENIIAKALKKYLNLFIVNFTKDSFNVSLLKGKATLSSIDLNAKVLQEVLMLPTNLEATKAYCSFLEVDVPWTRLGSKPISVVVEKIDIFLKEPDVLPPMPDELARFRNKKKKQTQSNNGNSKDILFGISVEIKEVNIFIQTLSNSKQPFEPSLSIVIKNVLMQSTSAKWEPADLNMCKEVDASNPDVTSMFKVIKATSITVALIQENGERIILVDQQPLVVHFISKWNFKERLWLGGNLQVLFDSVSFKFDHKEWKSVGNMIAGFRRCMSRQVPIEASNKTGETTTMKKDLSVGLKVCNCALQIHTSHLEIEGFRFDAKDFEVNASADAQGEYKSFVTLGSISLRTLAGRFSSIPLVSHEKQIHETNLITISISSHVMHEDSKEDYIADLSLRATLSSLLIVVDVPTWKAVKALLVEPLKIVPQVVDTAHTSQLRERLKTGLQRQIEKIHDFSIMKLFAEATDMNFIFCGQDSTHACSLIKAQSIAFSSDPKWLSVPLIQDEPSFHISTTSEDRTEVSSAAVKDDGKPSSSSSGKNGIKQAISKRISSNTVYRCESDWRGVTLGLISLNNIPQQELILKADNMKLFFRYQQTDVPDGDTDQFHTEFQPELALHMGTLYFNVTPEQLSKARAIIKQFTTSVRTRFNHSSKIPVLKDKLKRKIKDQIGKSDEALQLFDSLKTKVKDNLERYKVIVFLRADKGEFNLPISLFGASPSDVHSVPSSRFGFENLELGALNGVGHQMVLFNLKSIEARNLDHPKSSNLITLQPLVLENSSAVKVFSLNTRQFYNIRINYSRRQHRSEVLVKLHELQILLKPKAVQSSSSELPDIRKIIHQIIAMFDREREKIMVKLDKIKEKEGEINNLKSKIKLDLKWRVELENLSIHFEDKDSTNENSIETSKGIFHISNSYQVDRMSERFLELEKQLIGAKVELATQAGQAQMSQEVLLKQKKKSKNKQKKLAQELEKYTKLYKDMEEKYVQAKLKNSQLQMEYNNLEQEMLQLRRKK